MKFTKQIVAVLLVALTITACKTNYKKTKDGFPYTIFSSGSGEKIKPGNLVRFHLTNKMEDSLLSTTYGQSPQTVTIPTDAAALDNVKFFTEARKGDSILILQPVDSIVKANPQAAKDPLLARSKGKFIKIYIKIVDVIKDEATMSTQQKAKDDAEISAYLKQKNINATRTPNGVYIQTITPGNGQKPKPGQVVMLHYTGRLLSGEEFETNNQPGAPLLPVKIGAGGMIAGFEDVVKELSKGEKVIVYIPSSLAYGVQGNPPKIGPDQNIVFELEAVDITDKEPAPPTPPTTSQPDTTRK